MGSGYRLVSWIMVLIGLMVYGGAFMAFSYSEFATRRALGAHIQSQDKIDERIYKQLDRIEQKIDDLSH